MQTLPFDNALHVAEMSMRPLSMLETYTTHNSIYLPGVIAPLFCVGDIVRRKPFKTSKGHCELGFGPLTVVKVTRKESGYFRSWYHVKAVGENGHGYATGNESFFEKVGA